jgi:hypothetical protein
MEKIKKGKIMGFQGSWSSGLATLIIQKENGETDFVHCENAPTVRALDGAFGNVITEGHMVNNEAIKGKEIYYSIGSFGILEGFTPIEEASSELVEKYEKQKGRSKKKLKELI